MKPVTWYSTTSPVGCINLKTFESSKYWSNVFPKSSIEANLTVDTIRGDVISAPFNVLSSVLLDHIFKEFSPSTTCTVS